MKSIKVLVLGLIFFLAFYLGTLTGKGGNEADQTGGSYKSGSSKGGGGGGRGGRGMRRGIMGSLGGSKKSTKKSDSSAKKEKSQTAEKSEEGPATSEDEALASAESNDESNGNGEGSEKSDSQGRGSGRRGQGEDRASAANDNEQGGAEEKGSLVSVRVSRMIPRDMESTIEVSGTVLPVREVEVRARAAGILEEVTVEEGDRVEAGQTLAVIEADREKQAVAKAKVLVEEAELSLEILKMPPRDEEVQLKKLKVEQARIKLRQSKDQLDTNKELYRENLLIKNTLDATESDYEYLKSAYDGAKQELDVFVLPPREVDVKARELTLKQRNLDLRDAELALNEKISRSPIPGLITKRAVEPFDLVSNNQHLFTVADTAKFRIEARVPYGDAMTMSTGDQCRIMVESPQGFTACSGTVERIAPSVDSATGTVDAELVFTDIPIILKPGLFAKSTVVTEKRAQVPCLPREALLLTPGGVADGNASASSGSASSRKEAEESANASASGLTGSSPERGRPGWGVYILSGEAGVAFTEVTTGFQDDKWIQIISGLSPEDSVIVAGQNLIDERSRVKVLTAEVTVKVKPIKQKRRKGGHW